MRNGSYANALCAVIGIIHVFFFFTCIKSFRVTRELFEHEAARKLSDQISSERHRKY